MSRTMSSPSFAGSAKDMGGAPVKATDGLGPDPGSPDALTRRNPCTEYPMQPASAHMRV